MTPLLGFTPDAPRTTAGIVADCSAFIPYEAGMEAAPSRVRAQEPGDPSLVDIEALEAAAIAAISWTKLDATTRLLAATGTKIFERSGGAWNDRSAGGTSYTTTTTWTFAPFGAAIVAAGGTGITLQSSTTGTFAAIATAPKAKIVFPVITSGGGFVIALHTDMSQDGWACSGVNDYTTWTPAIATQANSGRLLGNDNSALTAGIEFGDRPLAFKVRTMFIGNYVGGDKTFDWGEVPGGAGCIGPYALCTVDQGAFFVGPDQLWVFDGARPMPIADSQVRQWFFNELSVTYRAETRVYFDRPRNCVLVFYPNQSSTGLCNACLVYHLVTKQWGRYDQTIECAFTFIQPGTVINNLTATINSYTNLIDGELWSPSARSPAVFGSDHIIYTLTGTPGSSSFTTADFGDEFTEAFMDEVRVRYDRVIPATAQAVGYVLDEAGDSADAQLTQASSDIPAGAKNKFDLRQCGRFHRVQFSFTGQTRVIGYQPRVQPAGGR